MNWRRTTVINAGIAAVTLIAVAYDLSRGRPREPVAKADSSKNNPQVEARRKNRLLAPGDDITKMRVNDLAVVPPSELYDILLRASPEQIAAIALKFNDLPDNSHSTGAIAIFFQAWGELDPTHALQGAFRLKNVTQRSDAVNVVTGSASPAAAPELAKMLADHPEDDLLVNSRERFIAGLMEKWGWVDPASAANFIGGVKGLSDQTRLAAESMIAHPWATIDPQAALAWIDELGRSNRTQREAIFPTVMTGWSDSDPDAAAQYLAQHFDTPASAQAATLIATYLLQKDPERLVQFLQGLPAGETKDAAEIDFGRYWAGKDPVAAARWLETLPENEQSQAVASVTGAWSAKDWPAASKWAAGLTGDLRDLAIASAVDHAADTVSPTEYLPLVLSIKDDQARNSTTEAVIARWANRDRDAATAWVKQSGLPKEEKQEILAMPVLSEQQ